MFHKIKKEDASDEFKILKVSSLDYDQVGTLGKNLRLHYDVDLLFHYEAYTRYESISNESAFTCVKKMSNNIEEMGALGLTDNRSWKIHISIHKDYVKDGWDIVIPILIQHEVDFFKVIRESYIQKLFDDPQQRGKVITIYCFRQPDKTAEYWCELMTEVTKALLAARIPAGPFPDDPDSPRRYDEPLNNGKEIKISGTEYCSYRTEKVNDSTPNPMVYSNGEKIKISLNSPSLKI